MECEVAEESVVVKKSLPEKLWQQGGGENGDDRRRDRRAPRQPKAARRREGTKLLESVGSDGLHGRWKHESALQSRGSTERLAVRSRLRGTAVSSEYVRQRRADCPLGIAHATVLAEDPKPRWDPEGRTRRSEHEWPVAQSL